MPNVSAVCISEKRGVRKTEVPYIDVLIDHGIVGDGHAGSWHRQISLLSKESIDTMQDLGHTLPPGAFAENIITVGIPLSALPVGTVLKIGKTRLEITQIGKECHNDCEIMRLTGKCVMPTQGVFAVVKQSGRISLGDEIEVLESQE